MSGVRDELQCVLEELFTDLFQCTRPADAAPLLRALASLAANSSSVQRRLGQTLLADAPSTVNNAGRVTRLQLLAENFLYHEASAMETLTLFAVLANGNVSNQRRIARNVKGVCVSSSQSCSQEPLTLLVLSLPNSLQAQYKTWNFRQRELLSHRVPTGRPPVLDGVPAACYCDECLGGPQLLATWVSHYEDLSRWCLKDHQKEENASSRKLSGEQFLQQTLAADHRLCQYRCVMDGMKERDSDAVDGVIWFFVTSDNEPSAPVPDPRRYACAIQIDPSIAGVVGNKSSAPDELVQQRGGGAACLPSVEQNSHQEDCEDLGRVLLLEKRMELPCCQSSRDRESSQSEAASWLPTIAHILSIASVGSESHITAGWLRSRVDKTLELAEWERRVFISIVCFLEPDSPLNAVEFRKMLHHDNEVSDDLDALSIKTEICDVRVETAYGDQTLKFVATTLEGDELAAQTFIAAVTVSRNSDDDDASGLLSISDESLLEVLQRCRLCRHSDPGGCSDVGSWIHLTSSQSGQMPVETSHKQAEDEPTKEAMHIKDSHSADSRGLSSAVERQLQVLGLDLTSERKVVVLDIAHRIRGIIHNCNERMALLASSSDRTDSQRKAGRERCRACRDLLIEAAKRMKLGSSADATATLSTVAKTRLQRAISRVLQLSGSVDTWEKPDERVQRLHLSKQVWASGVPDPEFYVDSEARAKTNRTAQRRLNRLLVQQTRQQRTPQA